MRAALPFQRLDLIEPRERVVQPLDECRDAVDRVEALIGIHFAGGVAVGGDLPAAAVERAQAGSRGLNRLPSRERPERRDGFVPLEVTPQARSAQRGQRVLRDDAALQPKDGFGAIAPGDAAPAAVALPASP